MIEREEVVDVFRKGKFELLALTETKLKGNGEVSWCKVAWWQCMVPLKRKLKKGRGSGMI